MTDYAPGSYATANGIPSGATQLAVYQHYNKYDPQPDHIVAWFLIDTDYYDLLAAQPPFGKWRLEERGKSTFAAWYTKSRDGQPGQAHYLSDEVWLLGHGTIPDDFYVGVSHGDPMDCRIDSLRLRRKIPLAYTRIRKIDHSNDRVSARLAPTSY